MAKTPLKKKNPKKKKPTLGKDYQGLLVADGFDSCIVGRTCQQPGRPPLVVYDYERCVTLLVCRDKMTFEEAVEYMEYNVVGAWVGANTPVFITPRY